MHCTVPYTICWTENLEFSMDFQEQKSEKNPLEKLKESSQFSSNFHSQTFSNHCTIVSIFLSFFWGNIVILTLCQAEVSLRHRLQDRLPLQGYVLPLFGACYLPSIGTCSSNPGNTISGTNSIFIQQISRPFRKWMEMPLPPSYDSSGVVLSEVNLKVRMCGLQEGGPRWSTQRVASEARKRLPGIQCATGDSIGQEQERTRLVDVQNVLEQRLEWNGI